MKKPSFALLLALALASLPASAAPDPALEPLAFLAGNCWIGTIPDTADTDEHCFTWVYEGRYLRDKHVVRRGEKAVYEGESIYYWNSAAKIDKKKPRAAQSQRLRLRALRERVAAFTGP